MASERELERLLVRMIGENTQYKKMLAESERATKKTTKAMDGASNQSFLRFNKSLGGGLSLTNRLGLAAGALAGSFVAAAAGAVGLFQAIKQGMELEDIEIQFGTMLGSDEAGKKMITDIQEMAARTPMTSGGLQRATQTMMQFGVETDGILDTLRQLGDISGGNEVRLQRLALAFGQVKSTGRLMGQDLLQMINVGFNPLQVISEQTGKSMKDLKKDMEAGNISFEMVAEAIQTATSEGGRFFNGMQRQSQTLSGLLSTIQDNVEIAMGAIGKDLIEAFSLKDAARGLIEITDQVRAWVQRIMPQVKAFLMRMREAWNEFLAFMTPLWNAIISLMQSGWEIVVQVVESMWEAIKEVWKSISDSTGITWAQIRDFIIEVFIMAEFAVRNFDKGFELAMLSVAVAAVRTFNQIVHILTVVLPAAGKYLMDNWKGILQGIFLFWVQTIMAMSNAMVQMFVNLPSLIKGEKTITDITGPIFQSWLKQMQMLDKAFPKFVVPERVVEGLEKDLITDLIDKGKKAFEDFLKFRDEKLKQFFGIAPEAPPAAEKAGKAAGKAFNKGMVAETGKSIKEVDHVLRRSAEAARRIQAQRDLLRNQSRDAARPGGNQDKQKELVDVNKQQLGVLGRINEGIGRLNPVGVANI